MSNTSTVTSIRTGRQFRCVSPNRFGFVSVKDGKAEMEVYVRDPSQKQGYFISSLQMFDETREGVGSAVRACCSKVGVEAGEVGEHRTPATVARELRWGKID